MTSPALPPYLMTSEKGSFARHTIEERKPLIIDQILLDYDYPDDIREALLAFQNELHHGAIRFLEEATSDRAIWDHDLQPWAGNSWLAIPWFLAEAYFYRRILEIVKYFQPGPWQGQDPYARLKLQEIEDALPVITELNTAIHDHPTLKDFQRSISRALWGNRSDLSNLGSFETDMSAQSEKILRNDSASAFEFLSARPARIAYVFDNTGKELFFDLALIHFLMRTKLACGVTCYLKNQPFFVSDGMPQDLDIALDRLTGSDSNQNRRLAADIRQWRRSGRIEVHAPPFFVTGRDFRQLPANLKKQLAEHDLAILKGDVNYRRLVGDRHWDPATPFGRAAGYFPTRVLSLRTMKAEMVVGLPPALVQDLEQHAEPDWMINGKLGLIAFLDKQGSN